MEVALEAVLREKTMLSSGGSTIGIDGNVVFVEVRSCFTHPRSDYGVLPLRQDFFPARLSLLLQVHEALCGVTGGTHARRRGECAHCSHDPDVIGSIRGSKHVIAGIDVLGCTSRIGKTPRESHIMTSPKTNEHYCH